MGLLASQSRPVVIYSLSLITIVGDRLVDTVFSKKNLNQTVPCIINVVLKGDELLGRATAVDILVRMGIREGEAEGNPESLAQAETEAELTVVGESLVAFPGLSRTLGPVAACLVHLSSQPDQLEPVLNLFLAFATVPKLRTPAIQAILNADPVQSRRLKTPLLSLIEIALPSLDSASHPQIQLKAQRLIRLSLEV